MPTFIMTHMGAGPSPEELKASIAEQTNAEILEAYGPVIVVSGSDASIDAASSLAQSWSVVRSRRIAAPRMGAAALGPVHKQR